jgi:hypothetical protein
VIRTDAEQGASTQTKQPKHSSVSKGPADSSHGSSTLIGSNSSKEHSSSTFIGSTPNKGLDIISEEVLHDSITEYEQLTTSRDDAVTVYSSTGTVDEWYMEELGVALFDIVEPCLLATTNLERISAMLPELLKAFSLKLNYKNSNPAQAEAAYFIRKNRKWVTTNIPHMIAKLTLPQSYSGLVREKLPRGKTLFIAC